MGSYNGVEGSYNAKLDASTGRGEFVQHSGGVGKTRVYDLVGDATGDLYMVGYTQASVVHWTGSLKTKLIEEGVDQDDDVGTAFQFGKQSTQLGEYQFFAVKLGAEASKAESPSCIESCNLENGVANPTIKADSCFIDNVCYPAGETAEIFGRNCLVCDPAQSKTEWSYGRDVGVNSCFIDNVCYDAGDAYTYRKSRSERIESECQVCDPSMNSAGWSVKRGFELASGLDIEPPSDCLAIGNSGSTPSLRPVQKPQTPPTNRPASNPPASNPPVGNTNGSVITISKNSGLSNGAKIGIGISVPLVLILVVLIATHYSARKDTGIEKDSMSEEKSDNGTDKVEGLENYDPGGGEAVFIS